MGLSAGAHEVLVGLLRNFVWHPYSATVEARRHRHVHSFIFMVSKSSEVHSSWARMWRIRLYFLRDSFTGEGNISKALQTDPLPSHLDGMLLLR